MTETVVSTERIRFGEPGFAEARDAELEIFGRVNGYASAEDLRAGQMLAYAPYEAASEFHVARVCPAGSVLGPVAGLMRYVRHDPLKGHDSFPTIAEFRRYVRPDGTPDNLLDPDWQRFLESTDPDEIAELATEAVLPRYRSQGIVLRLWESFDEVDEAEGVRLWVMALVLPLFDVYKQMFPDAVQAIGRVMPDFVGADSIPALIKMDHPEVETLRRAVKGRPARWPVKERTGDHG